MRGHRLLDVAVLRSCDYSLFFFFVPNPELSANREECYGKVKLHQRQRQEVTLTGRGPLSSEPWQQYLFQYFTKYARARKLQKNSRTSDLSTGEPALDRALFLLSFELDLTTDIRKWGPQEIRCAQVEASSTLEQIICFC